METYGDLKKIIKSVSLKQKGEKVGKIAIDTVLGAIPGIGAAKTSFDFFKAAFKKPDDKKTSSWLDKLDVDDEMSAIVDDTVENGFLKAISAAIEKKPDDEKLEPEIVKVVVVSLSSIVVGDTPEIDGGASIEIQVVPL